MIHADWNLPTVASICPRQGTERAKWNHMNDRNIVGDIWLFKKIAKKMLNERDNTAYTKYTRKIYMQNNMHIPITHN